MTVIIDYLHGELRSVCSGILDLQQGLLLLYSFYVYMYLCVSVQPSGHRR